MYGGQKDLEKITSRGKFLAARKLIEDFIYEPNRVRVIMRHFYERAIKSDKALIEYVKILIPQRETAPGVTVTVVSTLLDKPKGKVYDITGTPVEEAEVVGKDLSE